MSAVYYTTAGGYGITSRMTYPRGGTVLFFFYSLDALKSGS